MRRLALLAALLAGIATPAAAFDVGSDKAFAFVALGDMPYKLPDDYARFETLIGKINALKPSVSIHMGDIKSGSTVCSDEIFQKVKDEFALFEGPFVYTVGDNEWTDCHREKAGGYDPNERLNKVREMFFATPKSFGKTSIALERQSELMPDAKTWDGKTFVENTRFVMNGTMFVQANIIGSNNNLEARSLDNAKEFFARDAANQKWIVAAFEKAKAENLGALVLSIQADMWDIKQTEPDVPRASGFVNTLKTIEKQAKEFGKPVLVINGDAHFFEVTPFYGTDTKALPNVTRLQVPGEKIVGAVRVIVDPANPEMPFAFQEIGQVPAAKK
ncbi:hypothetical protein [Pinisolibacter aquiterrae]|uniref:hypothetical protein n=1 Tax=Pinisolibacter aquiterrae TaxID=2815579 RepID=UPI001C3C6A8B|nr:hypothetical protein [Pinisolibacter aquiterrae]MBV5266528.1 hypothetical protein [Pinisolibacter aquiterrae]MCC8234609.1 hypothetical protein [Pinisolibacter aquiterrae]